MENTIAELEARCWDPGRPARPHGRDFTTASPRRVRTRCSTRQPSSPSPLGEGPYGALDCTTSGSIYAGFTFGGLATRASGEVLDPTGTPIPGLYAAGRVAAALPRGPHLRASPSATPPSSAGCAVAAVAPVDA